MKSQTKLLLILLMIGEAGLAILLFRLLFAAPIFMRLLVLLAVVGGSLTIDWMIMRNDSAAVVSKPQRLKDTDDYIKAFEAWQREGTPFGEFIAAALRQLTSLKKKNIALRAILDETKDSPFLNTADEVQTYILANCKRILNRIMVFDAADSRSFRVHAAYIQDILNRNAKVLTDYENLILEVSQIGDDHTAALPCLNELTEALRSMREPEIDAFDGEDSTPRNLQQPLS